MPELPEVETIRLSLAPSVVGREIRRVDVYNANLRRPLGDDFAKRLEGRVVVGTRRRAKYLLFDLDNDLSWITHFGMSGTLAYQTDESDRVGTHDHVVAGFAGGGRLVFNDPRRFGLMTVEDVATSPLLEGIGPEPLDAKGFSGAYLADLKSSTNRMVKDVLMDQRVVAGLGNIYVNEILFLSGVRPTRRLRRITKRTCERVSDATRFVINEAIEHRGSSISDFLDGIGRRGAYQGRHRVYGRGGEPCRECDSVVKCVTIGQRSSFYCPECQT